jgi:AFG3 family protein
VPRSKGSLGFSQSETQDTKLKRSEEILDQICVLLGGRVGEEIHCAGITTGARDDIEKLTQLAYQYAATYGMDTTVGIIHYDRSLESHSEQFRQNIDDCVRKIINQSYERVKMTLLNNNDLVVSLTKELLEKETLLEDDIKRIFS